ncbi:hypothetical protein AB0M36_05680 [Actinoplanes sp. NPDC051346]|uniref:hypothetical protein n=1 Tax=Actinoplanes sp. NPDC051346 TaxID=3155048 RepID=UPI00343A828A
MTLNYDHATLFIAPPGVEAVYARRPVADGGADALRRLRQPFAVPSVPAAAKRGQ